MSRQKKPAGSYYKCPHCARAILVTRKGTISPHLNGGGKIRCAWSGAKLPDSLKTKVK